MISPRQHVTRETLEKKPCLPGVNLGDEEEIIETFEAKQMSMLCLKCGNYINLALLLKHRSFHEALALFQYDIQTKPTDLVELSSQRAALVKDLSQMNVNQSVYLKELGKIDLAYEILKSEMYGRLNKTRPNHTDHVVKIRYLKKNLNNATSMGVCQSSNGKWKSIMEDAYSYKANYITDGAFFGVYDGYNGNTAATKCANKLHGILKEKLSFDQDLKDIYGDCQLSDCFQQAYKEMDKVLLLGEEETSRNRWSGCSATTAILCGQHLHVANVGNVKAILIKGDATLQTLTEDHTPKNQDERLRMKKTRDVKKSIWANGIASTTRGLGNHGDPMLKLNVINSPGSCCVQLDSGYQIVLLCSGGFWEVFDENELLTLVQDWLAMKEGASYPNVLVTGKVENNIDPARCSSLHETKSKIERSSSASQEVPIDKGLDKRYQNCDKDGCNENGSKCGSTKDEQNKRPSSVFNDIPEQPRTKCLFSNLLKNTIAQNSCSISMGISKHLVNAALNGGAKSNITVMVVLCNGE